jgi:sigma-B regulation protein RsbU (phosphoserine phosphatase)
MTDGRLQVTDRQGRRVIRLDRPVFVIGRRTTADLQLVNADISREHAEIVRDESGQFLLRDRASRYGTFVNGEQITERTLFHNDTIRLGHSESTEVVFLLDDEASALRSASSDVGDLAQMAAILNGLRALGSGRVLDEVLTLVIDSALDVTKAERGFVMLAGAGHELEFKTARARGGLTLSGTSFTTSSKIPREVFATGTSRIVGDLLDGDLAGVHGGTIAIGIRHVLCVPLRISARSGARDVSEVIGVLYLDGRERGTLLSGATLSSLEAFATQAAIAIESARLYAESAEKARTDRDLRIAADIQRALLPDGTYARATFDLAAVSVPCRTVGGDFYDYLDVSDVEFGFALGDVAGKGPPAALLAAVVQSNFGALAPVSRDPADMMARLNKALLRRAIDARFATMCYGVASPSGAFSYSNAGQEPPLVVAKDGIRWLETGGPVLGLIGSATYEYETVQLAPGDLVIVCSDGVTEARSVTNEEFGRDRLLDVLRGMHGAKPDTALDLLLSAVNQFAHGAPQADDITVLVFRYRGSPDSLETH